jgi:hypothetical protein
MPSHHVSFIIGATRAQRVPALVTEHTIHLWKPCPVKVIHTWDRTQPEPLNPRNKARTGFSFVRFYGPHLLDGSLEFPFSDRMVYLDSDQLILQSWYSLAFFDLRGAMVGVPRAQCAVVVYDTERCQDRWKLLQLFEAMDTKKMRYEDVMRFAFLADDEEILRELPDDWNSCDRMKEGQTCLLHYTDMRRQPWVAEGHPLQDFWIHHLLDAVSAGRLSMDDVAQDVGAGYLRPTLLRDMKRVEGLPRPAHLQNQTRTA